MLTLLTLTSFAAPPVVDAVDSTGTWGTTTIATDPHTLMSLLTDPNELTEVIRVGRVLATTPDGVCTKDTMWMAQGAGSSVFTVRTCPTTAGQHSSLVESSDLVMYEADWKLTPVADGTEVTYSLAMKSPYDDSGVSMSTATREAVGDSLHYLERHFRPAPIAPAKPLESEVTAALAVD